MLTVICGEDTPASRKYLQTSVSEYKKNSFNITYLPLNMLDEILKNPAGTVDLFGKSSVYVVENLSSKYKGRGKSKDKDTIIALAKDSSIQVVDWEDGKSAYTLSSFKKVATAFHEFKPQKSIFDLLDQCYPKNINEFLATLDIVSQSQDLLFIYTLLWRHVRKLLLAKSDVYEETTQSWQKGRLRLQASKWDKKAIKNFYLGLIKIDFSQKSGDVVFDIKKSIEILACYYLK